tara:strand:- start:798 stop:1232 length:435 start_codon:yes stop_codon:yes gene_type:complete
VGGFMKKIFMTISLMLSIGYISANDKYSEETVSSISEQYAMYKGINSICQNTISMKKFQGLVGRVINVLLEEEEIEKSLWDEVKDKAWDQAVIPQDYQMMAMAMAYSSASEKQVYCINLNDQMVGMYEGILQQAEKPEDTGRDF